MAKKKHKDKLDISTTIKYIFTLLICIPLFISPLIRGLFFENEFLKISIYTSCIFLMFVLFYKKLTINLFDRKFDWAVLGLFIAYFLSTFNAAYIRDALLETTKVGTYFLIYIIVSRVCDNEKNKKLVLNTIFLTGIVVALTGISSQLKLIEFIGAFEGNRINTTIQYPNSAAAFLTAILLVGFYLWDMDRDKALYNLYYAVGNFVLLYTIIGTQSRGGWVILVLAVLGFFLLFDEQKNFLIIKMMLIIIFGLSAYLLVGQKTGIIPLMIILMGAIFVSMIIFMFQRNRKIFNSKWLSTRNIVFSLLILSIPLVVALNTYISYEPDSKNLLKNSEFSGASFIHWGLNGSAGEKRELVKVDKTQWMNITKKDENSSYWGIYQRIDKFKPDTSYTLSFDAFSELPNGKVGIIIHQLGPDGINPQKSTTLDITEKNRYQYTFTTDDLDQKEGLRIYLLLPNEPNAGNIYIGKVQLEEGSNATEYIKTKYKNQQILKIVERFKRIDLSESSFQARVFFYKDAIKMFKDKPLLGFGGGGWSNAYMKYQSYSYYTTTVHNHFLQVLVETGIIGFLFWCSIWFLILLRLLGNGLRKIDKINSTLLLSVFTLGTHNLIDFTFSLGAIAILFFVLLGLISQQVEEKDSIKTNNIVGMVLGVIVLATTMVIGIWFSTSNNELVKFQMERGYPINLAEVEKNLKVDFLNANYHALIAEASFQMYEKNNKQDNLEKALNFIERAINLDRYDYKWYMWKSKYLQANGDLDGLDYFSTKAIEYAPMQVSTYENKIQLLFKTYKELKEKNDDRYIEYEKEIHKVVARTQEQLESIPDEKIKSWRGTRPDNSKIIKEILEQLGGQ